MRRVGLRRSRLAKRRLRIASMGKQHLLQYTGGLTYNTKHLG